jgi:hypothetical protein
VLWNIAFRSQANLAPPSFYASRILTEACQCLDRMHLLSWKNNSITVDSIVESRTKVRQLYIVHYVNIHIRHNKVLLYVSATKCSIIQIDPTERLMIFYHASPATVATLIIMKYDFLRPTVGWERVREVWGVVDGGADEEESGECQSLIDCQ